MSKPKPRQLPEGYATIKWKGVEIAYIPSQQKVNATHLIKLGGVNRNKLYTFLDSSQIPKTIGHGNKKTQGSYIDILHARTVLKHFNLPTEVLGLFPDPLTPSSPPPPGPYSTGDEQSSVFEGAVETQMFDGIDENEWDALFCDGFSFDTTGKESSSMSDGILNASPGTPTIDVA